MQIESQLAGPRTAVLLLVLCGAPFLAAAAGLPPSRVATGSALANTSRQLGIVVGVALLVAVFGTPAATQVLDAFDRAWLTLAAIAVAAAIVSPRVTTREAVAA
jgi:hypothetical protein